MEENHRVEQFNQLLSLINKLKCEISIETSPTLHSVFPHIHPERQTGINMQRKPSSATIESSDLRKTFNDLEVKYLSNTEQIKPEKAKSPIRRSSIDTDRGNRTNYLFKKNSLNSYNF